MSNFSSLRNYQFLLELVKIEAIMILTFNNNNLKKKSKTVSEYVY